MLQRLPTRGRRLYGVLKEGLLCRLRTSGNENTSDLRITMIAALLRLSITESTLFVSVKLGRGTLR